MERTEQSIAAARKLALEGYFDFAASRAYYGAFYAATALVLKAIAVPDKFLNAARSLITD